MPQRPKDEIRQAIVDAAAAELASVGFGRTTLAGVAARARVSVGNCYRYFSSKEELFRAAVPDELAKDVARLVQARIEALGREKHPTELAADHPYWEIVRALTKLSIEHREALLFLLSRADGTAYEGYFEQRVRDLSSAALAYAGRAYPGLKVSAADQRAVHRAYHAFLTGLVLTLREETRPAALEHGIARLTAYHQGGLQVLFKQFAEK